MYEINRGLRTSKNLLPAQRTSSLFAEEPVVLGKVMRRGSGPIRISDSQYELNKVSLLRLEKAGSIVITRPEAAQEPDVIVPPPPEDPNKTPPGGAEVPEPPKEEPPTPTPEEPVKEPETPAQSEEPKTEESSTEPPSTEETVSAAPTEKQSRKKGRKE